jgi:hypothetical protein
MVDMVLVTYYGFNECLKYCLDIRVLTLLFSLQYSE